MKTIKNFLFEKNLGSSFKEEVKYSFDDFSKWLHNTNNKNIMIGNIDFDDDIILVYITNNKGIIMKHIATYNKKTQILCCDDVALFGHEVK